MDINNLPTYFLAANSADGFYSKFGESYSARCGWKAYIIKGGPGTGKSSLMRRIARTAVERGLRTEICRCSSDPQSLDAVIFPDIKKVILDGTAPHTVEPKYPAVCEQIVNTGAFWDDGKLSGKEKAVIELCTVNSSYHKKASQYIMAAGQISKANFGMELAATDIDKTFSFAGGLASKYIPVKRKKAAQEWVRFLSGITPDGVVFYGDTVTKVTKNQVVIEGKYGAVSTIIMSCIRDAALGSGYEIITIKNELLPTDIIDHIIIPELSLAFCTESRDKIIENTDRRIHSRRFLDVAALSRNRQKLTFNRRVIKELLSSACDCLKKAKQTHDEIEKYYVDIMDFESMGEYAAELTEKILK